MVTGRGGHDMRPAADPSGNARVSLVPKDPGPAPVEAWVAPAAPAELTELGQSIWHIVWDWGQRAFDPVSDVYVITRYCQAHEMAHSARAQLGTNFITLGSTGQERVNPLFSVVKEANAEMAKCEAVLGLNPEARARLGIAAMEADSKFDEFMKKKNRKD